MKVIFDPGHGGKDPGAVGNNLQEKDINLAVGLKAGKILERHNIEVIYTRTTDTFVELSERANMANKANVDIFVSFHANAAGNANAQGLETFSYPNSAKGTALAKCIQDSIIQARLYTKDRGIKTANFAVLRQTNMPAALVELGFITNSEDAKILRDKQNELALAVAKGVLNYLGIKYVNDKSDVLKINLHGKDLEVDGIIGDGTTYIPTRFLEKLGYKVGWENGKIYIDYKEE